MTKRCVVCNERINTGRYGGNVKTCPGECRKTFKVGRDREYRQAYFRAVRTGSAPTRVEGDLSTAEIDRLREYWYRKVRGTLRVDPWAQRIQVEYE